MVFPGGSDGKESACNAGDPGQSLVGEDPAFHSAQAKNKLST